MHYKISVENPEGKRPLNKDLEADGKITLKFILKYEVRF
jgi:hypothetical protein